MYNEQIAQLIARKLSGEATPEEIEELQAHFESNPADAYFASILSNYWKASPSNSPEENLNSEDNFLYILDSATNNNNKENGTGTIADEDLSTPKIIPYRRYLLIAASFTGLIFLSWWGIQLFRHKGNSEPSRIEMIAKPGARSRLLLPDGSTIWLNSGSKISYPANFSHSRRDVELEGEAYFDVVKNPNRPFYVHTGNIDIKVLGTVFNVKCYPEEDKTETTLIRGLVQISKSGEEQKEVLILHPHEKATLNNKGNILRENISGAGISSGTSAATNIKVHSLKKGATDTSIVETAWVYNKLVFDGEDFREISAEMERWFNVKIIINDPELAKYRFHAAFEHENISEVLSALQLSLPFTFKINNNEINIYKK